MKSALLAAPRRFEIADVDVPQPAAGEALVRVRSVGVCGSDLHFYRGEFPLPAGFCLGHEVSGEVEALGKGVSGFSKGDPVALELFTVCRSCPQCRSGNYHLCRRRKSNGIDIPGGSKQRITSLVHRRSAGVICEAFDLHFPLRDADDTLNDSNVDLLAVEYPALFDMQFEISCDTSLLSLNRTQL